MSKSEWECTASHKPAFMPTNYSNNISMPRVITTANTPPAFGTTCGATSSSASSLMTSASKPHHVTTSSISKKASKKTTQLPQTGTVPSSAASTLTGITPPALLISTCQNIYPMHSASSNTQCPLSPNINLTRTPPSNTAHAFRGWTPTHQPPSPPKQLNGSKTLSAHSSITVEPSIPPYSAHSVPLLLDNQMAHRPLPKHVANSLTTLPIIPTLPSTTMHVT
jgi:hypothetical protein